MSDKHRKGFLLGQLKCEVLTVSPSIHLRLVLADTVAIRWLAFILSMAAVTATVTVAWIAQLLKTVECFLVYLQKQGVFQQNQHTTFKG
jgi:hypothetical protein